MSESLPIDTNFVSILLLVSVLFADPLPSFKRWAVSVGGEELKWRQLKAKSNYKTQISGKLVTSSISEVATASVHSEKTRMTKMIMIIIIMNKLQETTVFHGRQKMTSAMK